MRPLDHFAQATQSRPSKANPALSAGGRCTTKRSTRSNVSFFFRSACAGYGHTPHPRLGDLVQSLLQQRGLGP